MTITEYLASKTWVCDHCGEVIPTGDLNSSEVISGMYHGRCLAKLVTFEQEREAIDVAYHPIGRSSYAAGVLAARRELGDMD